MMAVGDTHVFPGFLTPVLTQLFFPKPPTTFLTSFCRGEGRKYTGKEVRLNRGSNSQPPGHESDMLTTELLASHRTNPPYNSVTISCWTTWIPPWVSDYRISPNNAPVAKQSIDWEPLFCTQFAKQKVCPIVSAGQVFWKHCGKRRNCS